MSSFAPAPWGEKETHTVKCAVGSQPRPGDIELESGNVGPGSQRPHGLRRGFGEVIFE
jgi:hypothetical protein